MGKRSRANSPPALLGTFGSDKYDTKIDSTVDYGTSEPGGLVEVLFRNHTKRLIDLINQQGKGDVICGAVAWFTNCAVLDALHGAKQRGAICALVVQKEEFLRNNRTDALHKAYRMLGTICNYTVASDLIGAFSTKARLDDNYGWWLSQNDNIGAVRCVGNHNTNNIKSFARMHHKFIVFGKYEDNLERGRQCVCENKCPDCNIMDKDGEIQVDPTHQPCYYMSDDPYADQRCAECGLDGEDGLCCETCCKYIVEIVPKIVWTGSFNLSLAAEKSFENVTIIRSKEIALAYQREFSLMYLLSEPLDWVSAGIQPSIVFSKDYY